MEKVYNFCWNAVMLATFMAASIHLYIHGQTYWQDIKFLICSL